METSELESIQYKVFKLHRHKLSRLLIGSLADLSDNASAESLITSKTSFLHLEKAFAYTASERTTLFLRYIMSNMDGMETAQADAKWSCFLQKGLEDTFYNEVKAYLKKKCEEFKKQETPNPAIQTLVVSRGKLVPKLEADLEDIASRLRGSLVLSIEQYEKVVDPMKGHNDLCMEKILNEIEEKIQQDAGNYDKFLKVLESLGSYYDGVVRILKSAIKNLEKQEEQERKTQREKQESKTEKQESKTEKQESKLGEQKEKQESKTEKPKSKTGEQKEKQESKTEKQKEKQESKTQSAATGQSEPRGMDHL